MHAELEKLAHLQAVEQRATAVTLRLADYSSKISARQAAIANAARDLEENTAALAKEAAERRAMESDTQDLRQKLDRYRAQLDGVQSDNQMRALQHQIEFCKQEIDRLENLELTSLMTTETLDVERRTLDETIANLKLALANEEEVARLGQQRDQQQLTELSAERKTVRESLTDELLSQYDRMASAGKAPVAEVAQQRCSACQMMIRPQRWNDIRGGAVHFCESCGRFLYYNPAVDLSGEIHLPHPAKNLAEHADTAPGSKTPADGSEHPALED